MGLTQKGFTTAYAMLSSEFKGEVTDMQVETHRQMLIEDGITDEELMSGVKTIIRSRKYANFPKYAELLEAIRGNPDDKAVIALKQAEEAVAEFGSYKSVIFKDKALQATIEAFLSTGWIGFCEIVGTNDWKFEAKKFTDLYKAFLKQGREPKSIYLIGTTEKQNRYTGADKEYDIEVADGKVRVLGLCEKQEAVYLVGYEPEYPKALPNTIIKQLIQAQQAQLESKRDVSGLIADKIKKVGE